MSTQVQAQIKTASQPSFTSVQTGLLQRQCSCGQHTGGGECAECRQKREGTLQRSAVTATFTPIHSGTLQRCSGGVECSECRQKREKREVMMQRAAEGNGSISSVPPIVHDVLNSPGQPLDAETQAFMEQRFGHDFSGVSVHADARAAESARLVNALAYTVGRNVVFGAGQYIPGTFMGKRLLAHELTHTIQQSQGQLAGISMISAMRVNQPGDSYEQEADRTAQTVMNGESKPSRAAVSTTSSPTLQRAPDGEPVAPAKPIGRSVLRSVAGTIWIVEIWQKDDNFQKWFQRAQLFYLRWRFGNVSPELRAQLLKILEATPTIQFKGVTPVAGQSYGLELGT